MDMCAVCNGLWVTDRFPRAGKEVLVSTSAGVWIAAYSKQGYWHADARVLANVKAWLPLPRKYRPSR
jgi:hypothetical protein